MQNALYCICCTGRKILCKIYWSNDKSYKLIKTTSGKSAKCHCNTCNSMKIYWYNTIHIIAFSILSLDVFSHPDKLGQLCNWVNLERRQFITSDAAWLSLFYLAQILFNILWFFFIVLSHKSQDPNTFFKPLKNDFPFWTGNWFFIVNSLAKIKKKALCRQEWNIDLH